MRYVLEVYTVGNSVLTGLPLIRPLIGWKRSGPTFLRRFSTIYQIPLGRGVASVPLLQVPSHLGHYTSRVNRPYNEDRYFAGVLKLPANSSLTPRSVRVSKHTKTRNVFNYSVFDGHGGSECADFLKTELGEYIENCDLTKGKEIQELYRTKIGGYWRAWKHEIERYLSKLTVDDDLELRVPLAYLKADYDFVQQNETCGSTCTSVFLYSLDPTKMYWDADQVSNLVVAHVGDTRCILADNLGNVHPLTINHHPSTALEATRLKRYSASFYTDSFGEERFDEFANTRAFGDLRAKAKGVSAEPDIVECQIGDPTKLRDLQLHDRRPGVKMFGGNEAFLIVMSDGVSGMVSDQELVDLTINTANQSGYGRGSPQDAAEEIVKYAEALGGDDNATCMVVRLSGWGLWNWKDRTGALREDRLRDAFDKRNRRQ